MILTRWPSEFTHLFRKRSFSLSLCSLLIAKQVLLLRKEASSMFATQSYSKWLSDAVICTVSTSWSHGVNSTLQHDHCSRSRAFPGIPGPLLLCLLHCNLTQVGFETCWVWSAKKNLPRHPTFNRLISTLGWRLADQWKCKRGDKGLSPRSIPWGKTVSVNYCHVIWSGGVVGRIQCTCSISAEFHSYHWFLMIPGW